MSEGATSTSSLVPALELRDAQPIFDESGLTSARYNLRLMPGECALITCRDVNRSTLFADLCSGLIPLGNGSVRCQGMDWTELPDKRAWALRGRIGRIMQQGAWVNLFGTDLNILMQQLHHTRTPTNDLIASAGRLSRFFGLPGLPTLSPGRLSVLDLQRAACVRAFLGEPHLLLLENPVTPDAVDLMTAFLAELTGARQRGCAVVWFARNDSIWRNYRDADVQRFRLLDEGLFPMRLAS
ncbi:P-loop NTPase family protein [Kozakia baliensis]|uniref:ABC transporter ATP-binding protein n=1 Tax=Kozakia baliensis TaxID=153496 RepID=UPI000879C697|nr:ABC transporter ATP-binding protein [Kozakia baliensis]AOX20129.1 ABC transporter ATP-binding protein [Kozakia baliensis]